MQLVMMLLVLMQPDAADAAGADAAASLPLMQHDAADAVRADAA